MFLSRDFKSSETNFDTQSPSSSPSPSPKKVVKSLFPLHENIKTTVFWVGEKATADNGYITNEVSFWDNNWQENFGGEDTPFNRNGYYPSGFIPKENPFYFALPYADYDNSSSKNLKESTKKIPWFAKNYKEGRSIVKNRWIAIGRDENTCYAQWQDVGPGETDDFDYVFSNSPPRNSFTGIDISPAVRDCLKVGNRSVVWWQFIEEKDVPDGPWKQIITTSF